MKTEEFKDYLNQIKEIYGLKDGSIEKYTSEINNLKKENKEMFDTDDLNEFIKEKNKLFKKIGFIEKDIKAHCDFSRALRYYEKFIISKKYYEKIKNSKDIMADEYDGVYKLVRETVKQYNYIPIEKTTVADADLIYLMTTFREIGTKIDLINKSNLGKEQKDYLLKLIEEISNEKYEHEKLGIFKATPGTLAVYGKEDKVFQNLIEICINIVNKKDEEEILEYINKILDEENEGDKKLEGITRGIFSQILHCINPTIFPIMNGKYGEKLQFYKQLGINVDDKNTGESCLKNVKVIKEYRDKNFKWKNYRVIDLILMEEKLKTNKFVFGGVYWNRKSQFQRFLEEEIWENGYEDKNIEKVNSIEEGTYIIAKATYTLDPPYVSSLEKASVLEIKAIGRVNKNFKDGKTLGVDWIKIFDDKKIWYKFTGKYNLWETISDVLEYEKLDGEWKNLIEFAFFDKEQDYQYIYEKERKEIEQKLKQKDGGGIKINNIGKNEIICGVPGSGKSYYLNKIIKKLPKEQFERVVFYPEYSYYDFIGQKYPNKEAVLEFEPGPFTRILERALNNSKKEYYLIIEEMNRGNAEAIFGDILQLLDRNNGESEYGIYNVIQEELKITDEKVVEKIKNKGIYIPSNLSIYASLNNADQNVFNIDTAFGRRWEYTNMPCDPEKIDDKLYKNGYIKGTNAKWNEEIRQKINNKILQAKDEIYNYEDKRIGLYYIDKDCLVSEEDKEEYNDSKEYRERFANKIFRYLWLDVFKNANKEEFFYKKYDTLESIINDFIKFGNINNILKLEDKELVEDENE